MYTNNKIRDAVEIKQAGSQSPFSAFYIYIVPISASSPTCDVFEGQLSSDSNNKQVPLTAMTWNPVVFNSIQITEANLSNYRFFAGIE